MLEMENTMRTEQSKKPANANRSPDLVYLELPALLLVILAMLFVMSSGSRPVPASQRVIDSAPTVVQIEDQQQKAAAHPVVASRETVALNSRATGF
jgi:hypothetical protein